MPFSNDLLTNLAASLATELLSKVAGRLHDAAMPAAFNQARPRREELEALLLNGVRVADSHTSRRRAITALGRLRVATPQVFEALLAAAWDVAAVQEDAIAAAGLFRHLSRRFSSDPEASLAPLVEALGGDSTARAYLAALGTAPGVLAVPGLREKIAGHLSAALRRPDAGREVYLFKQSWLGESRIESQGPLSKTLFEALVQVWGLP